MRLSKRSIGNQFFTITDSDAASRGYRVQLRAGQVVSARLYVLCELHVFAVKLTLLNFADSVPRLFVVVNQKHVFHVCLLVFCDSRTLAFNSTTPEDGEIDSPREIFDTSVVTRKVVLRTLISCLFVLEWKEIIRCGMRSVSTTRGVAGGSHAIADCGIPTRNQQSAIRNRGAHPPLRGGADRLPLRLLLSPVISKTESRRVISNTCLTSFVTFLILNSIPLD